MSCQSHPNVNAQAGVAQVGYHTNIFLGGGQRERSALVTSDIDTNTKGRAIARSTGQAKSMPKHALYTEFAFHSEQRRGTAESISRLSGEK